MAFLYNTIINKNTTINNYVSSDIGYSLSLRLPSVRSILAMKWFSLAGLQ